MNFENESSRYVYMLNFVNGYIQDVLLFLLVKPYINIFSLILRHDCFIWSNYGILFRYYREDLNEYLLY